MTTTTTTLADRLRAWAKGIYAHEAGVELLIRHGKAIYEGAPWINDDGELAWLDTGALLDGCGAWSGGEQRIVHLAVSLIGDERVDLAEVLSGNDRHTTALVLAAIAHASGTHEATEVQFTADGRHRLTRPGTLYAWPDE